jgi:hypothetical protein
VVLPKIYTNCCDFVGDGLITDKTYINNEDITSLVYAFPYINNPAIFLQRSGKMIMINITAEINSSAERYTPIFRLPSQYRIANMEHDINFYCITSSGKAYSGVMNTAGEMYLVSESGLQAESLVKMQIVYALP